MDPLISVIVPVYNGQDYLTGCIESIENQTCGQLEIIIVNDGSTDRTAAVCDSLQAAYDNVRILNLDDKGVSAARNAGMAAAAGEFITFVDADDRMAAGGRSGGNEKGEAAWDRCSGERYIGSRQTGHADQDL